MKDERAADGAGLTEGGNDTTVVQTPQLTHDATLSTDEEIDALKEFAAKMQRMSPNGRRAAIYWLADFYLGIKWWGR